MNQFGRGSIIEHPVFGEGVIVEVDKGTYTVYFAAERKVKEISKEFEGLKAVEVVAAPAEPLDEKVLEKAFTKVLYKYIDVPEFVALGGKWLGGRLILEPGDDNLQSKEIPIETFFHKIVMVRDRLRVLEQNINANNKLDDEDKVNLQQYITRVYGSLTTFNLLFSNKDNYFTGSSTKD